MILQLRQFAIDIIQSFDAGSLIFVSKINEVLTNVEHQLHIASLL
jgi:hypothetical protein